MTSIFVSVGQCGNQLSSSLLDYLLENQSPQISYLYNNFDGKYRFINLDSEIKVINRLIDKHKDHIRAENVLNTRCGRGSNWASGYAGLKKDGALKIIDQSLEAIRKESERCDFLLNFNVMHSLSGGTGSGCGSKLIEQLRDEYGNKKYIFTQSVAPFSDGELPLQHYNNLLCLSHLNQFVDCISLYQNDDIMRILEKMTHSENPPQTNSSLVSKTGLQPYNVAKLDKKQSNSQENPLNSISIEDMNSYIIKCLLNTILPVDNISLKSQSIGMELFELQRFLCSNPNLKIIELYNIGNSNNNLNKSSSLLLNNKNSITKQNPLVKQIFSIIPKYKQNVLNYHQQEQFTSINSLIIARSSLADENNKYQLSQLWQDFELIKKNLNPVEWNPYTIDFWCSKLALNEPQSTLTNQSAKSQIKSSSSLTVALNRNKCVDYLSEVLEKSYRKFKSKAYLHWYTKFGIDDDHFEISFNNLRLIIESYNQMTTINY